MSCSISVRGITLKLQLFQINSSENLPICLGGTLGSRIEPVKIDAAGHFGIPIDAVLACRLSLVDECCYRHAEGVEDGEPDAANGGEIVADLGRGVEGVGIILVQREFHRF